MPSTPFASDRRPTGPSSHRLRPASLGCAGRDRAGGPRLEGTLETGVLSEQGVRASVRACARVIVGLGDVKRASAER